MDTRHGFSFIAPSAGSSDCHAGCCFVSVGVASGARAAPRVIVPGWDCPTLGLEEWEPIFHDPRSHEHWCAVLAMIHTPHSFFDIHNTFPKVTSVDLSSDGRVLASGSGDHQMRICESRQS